MYLSQDYPKITTHVLQEMKQRGEKIAMLTGYDYSMARLLDEAGIDIILVGDSASNCNGRACNYPPYHTGSDDLSCLFSYEGCETGTGGG